MISAHNCIRKIAKPRAVSSSARISTFAFTVATSIVARSYWYPEAPTCKENIKFVCSIHKSLFYFQFRKLAIFNN